MGLRTDEDVEFVVDQSLDLKEEFGESRIAFWPMYPPSLQDLTGCVVRFRCQRTDEFGDTATNRYWQKVARAGNGWDCHRFGYRIVELGVEADFRQEPRWVAGMSESELVFVRQKANSLVVGPWRVGKELAGRSGARELIPHPEATRVHCYPIGKLDYNSIFSADVPSGSRRKKLELLLYPPDESLGEPLDLFTPRQLANWLIEQINRHAPDLIVRLDRESPGWRGRIREEVEGYSDSKQRLFRERWQRLEAILATLVFDAEQVDRLLQHPSFLERLDSALAARVEDAVLRRSAEIETEAANLASAHRARLEGEIAELEARRSVIETELAKIDARRREQEQREQRLREMTEHLTESRNRLILDAAALQPFFGTHVSEPSRPNGQLADCP